MQTQKVSIIGLGYIGTTLAVFLCEKGLHVYGIDTNRDIINKVSSGLSPIHEVDIPESVKKYSSSGNLKASSDMSVIRDTDVVLVSVGTPLNEQYSADLSAIKEASTSVAKHLRKGHLIIYKSTVVPGTMEDIVLPILERISGLKAGEEFMLAFCPERLGEGSRMSDFGGSALDEMKTLPIVVGGINDQSTNAALEFWTNLGVKTVKVSSARVAETVKLADNWWIDLNIALANELAFLCEKLDIDAYEVIAAANTLPKNQYNVNILLPGSGVGGSCLTKDPWFVHNLGEKYDLNLVTCKVSREVNDSMPRHMYNLVDQALTDIGKNINKAKVSVLGLSFKQSTGDIRYTPTKPLIEMLAAGGAKVKVMDPWVNREETRVIAGRYIVDTLDEALNGTDCIVLMTAHPEFRKISFNKIRSLVSTPCAVVDGRRAFDFKKVVSAGFTYWAVGLGKKS